MIARARSCILALALIAGLVPLWASADTIDSFAVSVHVRPDGAADVTETILYDFGPEKLHGIYRNIPVEYQDSAGKRKVFTIDTIAVTDGAGTPYHFTSVQDGGDIQIKIGSEKVLVTGKKTYEISYVAHNVVGFFRDHDELYWNATGNAWQFPILESSARVYAPASTTQSSCYIGVIGSQTPCKTTESIASDGSALFFKSGRALIAGEGLTVAVGFPKGFVMPPANESNTMQLIIAIVSALIPIAAFLYLFRRWWLHGRDARGRGTIIPEYDSPEGITPAMASYIMHERVRSASLSATLIELAVRGYLTIHREEETTLGVFSHVKYRFDKTKPEDAELSDDEKTLFNALFKNGDSVWSDDLKTGGDLLKAKQKIGTDLAAKMQSDGYYSANPTTQKGMYAGGGIAIAVLGGILAAAVQSPWIFVGLLITGLLFVVFGLIMPAKTQKGVLVKEHILGLKDYLQIAEKNRLDFHNAPEKSPALFEKLLPYAIVLGVSAAWAKEFEGLYATPPSWYSGGSYAAFAPTAFVDDMNSMTSTVTALATPTSGSGGSGGGGFSGGGFGGGGGGSW